MMTFISPKREKEAVEFKKFLGMAAMVISFVLAIGLHG